MNQSIVDTAMFVDNGEGRQGSLFIETVTLSQMFFDQPKKHPVPVEEAAVRQIPRLRPSDVCLTYHVRGMPRSCSCRDSGQSYCAVRARRAYQA